jgi:low affinity Fe/Cu permease
LFQYSDTWQLVINTGTTIVTFLMVFLIQNSQNRDNAAIQVKLDELIRVSEVKNRFVGIERLSDEEIEELRVRCEARAKAEGDEAVRRVGKVARAAQAVHMPTHVIDSMLTQETLNPFVERAFGVVGGERLPIEFNLVSK